MKLSRIYAAVAASVAMLAGSAQAIEVIPESSGATIADTIVGEGVTISNLFFFSAPGASGTFTDGHSAGLDIDSGVIISTGLAESAEGPNSNAPDIDGIMGDPANPADTGESSTNLPGHGSYAPLEALVGGAPTNDASVLMFDFEFDGGAGGDLHFNFLFGSEEYNDFVNDGFNDVFAFFLDGVNVATLDDGSPVSIDSINLGTSHADLFNDNTDGHADVEFDGYSSVIEIVVEGLSAGVHTMEFAIADVGDSSLDSWVLIESFSFANAVLPHRASPPPPAPGGSGAVPVNSPASAALFGFAMLALVAIRRRK